MIIRWFFLKTIYVFISLHQVFVAACGIFVIREIQFPDRGSNSCPHCPSLATPTPTLATQSLPLDHQGSPSDFFDNSHIAINIYIQIFIFLGLCLRVELLSHVVTRYEELLDCFPKYLHDFMFPPAVYKLPNFSTSQLTLLIMSVCLGFFFFCYVFLIIAVGGVWSGISMWVLFTFLWWLKRSWTFFICLLAICISALLAI